jgi:hypothetical protein
MATSTTLPIEALITTRCRDLGLSRADIVRRAGLKNVEKGIRRLDGLYAGDLNKATVLIRGLPAALGLPTETVDIAIKETHQQLEEAAQIAAAERDAEWRATFKPCAYLLGTETRPTQIFIFAISGGAERWLRIPLDLTQPAVTFAAQAHAVVRTTPVVPLHGATVGFVVNYTPDCAVRFDLNGNPVEVFDRAYTPGQVSIKIGRRKVPAEVLSRMLGPSTGDGW